MRYQAGKSEKGKLLEMVLGNAESTPSTWPLKGTTLQVFSEKTDRLGGLWEVIWGQSRDERSAVRGVDWCQWLHCAQEEEYWARGRWGWVGSNVEGEMGPHRVLWIPLNRKRLRDTVSYVDHGMHEGSRQIRNITDDDRGSGRIVEHNNLNKCAVWASGLLKTLVSQCASSFTYARHHSHS